jgi:hypothetical protein
MVKKLIFALCVFLHFSAAAQAIGDNIRAMAESGDVHHVNKDGIPIVNSVVNEEKIRDPKETNLCIKMQHDLTQHVEDLNGTLFKLETDHREYYVRHYDRMGIIALIQREIVPVEARINHAIFHAMPGGSGAYCAKQKNDAIELIDKIYNANLEYRHNGSDQLVLENE